MKKKCEIVRLIICGLSLVIGLTMLSSCATLIRLASVTAADHETPLPNGIGTEESTEAPTEPTPPPSDSSEKDGDTEDEKNEIDSGQNPPNNEEPIVFDQYEYNRDGSYVISSYQKTQSGEDLLISKSYYEKNGKIDYRVTYTYHEDGTETLQCYTFNSNGEEILTEKLLLNSNGDLLESYHYDPTTGALSGRSVCYYEANGDYVMYDYTVSIEFEKEWLTGKSVYTAATNILESFYCTDDWIYAKYVQYKDQSGNDVTDYYQLNDAETKLVIVSRIVTDANGGLVREIYYDENGNEIVGVG